MMHPILTAPGLSGLCAAFFALSGGAAAAQDRNVATVAALMAALSHARGGETILLAGGEYGALALTDKSGLDVTFAAPVTLASADPGNPAVFSGLDLRDTANLAFDGVVFDYTFRKGHPVSTKPFSLTNSTDITIRNSTFNGDLARGVSDSEDGYGWGRGLSVSKGTRVTIENNEFFDFHRALTMAGGSGNLVRGNDVHSIRSDGMNFIMEHNLLIEGNYLHDFKRALGARDHADMIQFWTNGTSTPSTDITIRGNVLMAGAGGSTQSIFMRNDMVDRGRAGREMFYQNILIEDNVIINGHLHGITVGETDGLVIRQNTLLRNQRFAKGAARQKKVTIPSINLKNDSVRVTIDGNLAPGFPAPRTGWTVRNNMVVQDISPMQGGYYHKLFLDALRGDPQVLDNFAYRPGGGAEDPRLGAALLQPGANRARYAPRCRRSRRAGLPFALKSGCSDCTGSDPSKPEGHAGCRP